MLMCQNCGVELSDNAVNCPLCRMPVGPDSSGDMQSVEIFNTLPASDKKKIFLEVFSVSSLIGCFVVVAVELIISRTFWWSLYPIGSIAYLFTLVCVPIIFQKHPRVVYFIIAAATLLFVFLIALVSRGMRWFWPVALPIALVVELSVSVCVAVAKRSGRKGLNVIALVLLGISAVSIGIETVLNLYTGRRFLLSWSAVAATAATAIAVFLFYVHYRFNNRSSLKKLFHI